MKKRSFSQMRRNITTITLLAFVLLETTTPFAVYASSPTAEAPSSSSTTIMPESINPESWDTMQGQDMARHETEMEQWPNSVGATAVSAPITNDPRAEGARWIDTVRAREAWAVTGRGQGVVVAVIDSGVQANHEDLEGQAWVNPNEVPGDGIDNDGNGYVDDVNGWDFVEGGANSLDSNLNYHGTAVAGVIGAKADNELGSHGIAPDVTNMDLRVLNSSQMGSDVAVANAIRYAADNGAHVINLSIGGLSGNATNWIDAIDYAHSRGVLISAASGNNGFQFAPDLKELPADRNALASNKNTLSVGATNNDNEIASFSNFGHSLDIVAPGSNLYGVPSIQNADLTSYGRVSGTSFAAPVMSGALALLIQQDPATSLADVRRRLKYTSSNVDTLRRSGEAIDISDTDIYDGAGLLNIESLVSYDFYEDGSIRTNWLSSTDDLDRIRYDYDLDGRLTSYWLDEIDSLGNIIYDLTESGVWQGRAEHYGNGQIKSLKLTEPNEDGVVEYGYDIYGNVNKSSFANGDVLVANVKEGNGATISEDLYRPTNQGVLEFVLHTEYDVYTEAKTLEEYANGDMNVIHADGSSTFTFELTGVVEEYNPGGQIILRTFSDGARHTYEYYSDIEDIAQDDNSFNNSLKRERQYDKPESQYSDGTIRYETNYNPNGSIQQTFKNTPDTYYFTISPFLRNYYANPIKPQTITKVNYDIHAFGPEDIDSFGSFRLNYSDTGIIKDIVIYKPIRNESSSNVVELDFGYTFYYTDNGSQLDYITIPQDNYKYYFKDDYTLDHVELPNGVKRYYDSDGVLVSIEDPRGPWSELALDPSDMPMLERKREVPSSDVSGYLTHLLGDITLVETESYDAFFNTEGSYERISDTPSKTSYSAIVNGNERVLLELIGESWTLFNLAGVEAATIQKLVDGTEVVTVLTTINTGEAPSELGSPLGVVVVSTTGQISIETDGDVTIDIMDLVLAYRLGVHLNSDGYASIEDVFELSMELLSADKSGPLSLIGYLDALEVNRVIQKAKAYISPEARKSFDFILSLYPRGFEYDYVFKYNDLGTIDTVIMRDADGYIAKRIYLHDSGVSISRTDYFDATTKKRIRREIYRVDGSLRSAAQYNSIGQKTHEYIYGNYSNLQLQRRYTYWPEGGLRQTISSDSEGRRLQRYSYRRDNGTLEQLDIFDPITNYRIRREIYRSNGELRSVVEYDPITGIRL